MTFRELIQAKIPTRYLGARPVAFWRLANQDALAVAIEGSEEPVIIGGMDIILANRLAYQLTDIPERMPPK